MLRHFKCFRFKWCNGTSNYYSQDGPVLEHLVAGETGTLLIMMMELVYFLWVAGSIGSALAIFLANRNHGGDNNKGNEADITAPSKPGLTAEDDGSVSIDFTKRCQ